MCIVEIEPVNNRQRELVRTHGKRWRIRKTFIGGDNIPRRMECFKGQLGLQIESLDGKHKRNIQVSQINRKV